MKAAARTFAAALMTGVLTAGPALAQCDDFVAGESVEGMIAQAGSAEALYEMSLAQIAEYDIWLAEMEVAMQAGIAVNEMRALYDQGVTYREIERQIAAAAACRM